MLSPLHPQYFSAQGQCATLFKKDMIAINDYSDEEEERETERVWDVEGDDREMREVSVN